MRALRGRNSKYLPKEENSEDGLPLVANHSVSKSQMRKWLKVFPSFFGRISQEDKI